MSFKLTRKAEDDIIRIYRTGAELFGAAQAARYHEELAAVFKLLADNPKLARERGEISPAVRIHPHKSHLIVYRIEDNQSILIIRVRHGHEDWDSEAV